MTEKKKSFPIRIVPDVAAAGFLKRFEQATTKDSEDLQQMFYWFEQQGKDSTKDQEKAGPAKADTLQ